MNQISEPLKMFQEILVNAKRGDCLELTARPHPDTKSHSAIIAIEINSQKDKEFALDLLDKIYKEAARQQRERKK